MSDEGILEWIGIESDDDHRHHHHHHHKPWPVPELPVPKYFDIEVITITNYRTKDYNMAAVTLIDGQSTVGTVGATTDANGQVTTDPVAPNTITWTVDNPLVTLVPAADGLSVALSVAAGVATGTVNLSGAGTTVAGVAVTGSAVITIAAPAVGAPVNFGITFSTPA